MHAYSSSACCSLGKACSTRVRATLGGEGEGDAGLGRVHSSCPCPHRHISGNDSRQEHGVLQLTPQPHQPNSCRPVGISSSIRGERNRYIAGQRISPDVTSTAALSLPTHATQAAEYCSRYAVCARGCWHPHSGIHKAQFISARPHTAGRPGVHDLHPPVVCS